jgi:hypothetical protein
VHDEPAISPVQRSIGFAGAGSNYVDTNTNTKTKTSADYEDDEEIKPKAAPTRKAYETTKKPFEKPKSKILTLTASVGASDIQEATTPVNIEVPLRPLVNIKGRPKGFARTSVAPTSTTTDAAPSTISDAETKDTKKPFVSFRGKTNKLGPASTTTTEATTVSSKTTVKATPAITTTTVATTTTTLVTIPDIAVEEVATEAIPISIV